MTNLITTEEAAAVLGVTPRRVRALIASGRLPAQTLGTGGRAVHVIDPADLKQFKARKAGRPKGSKKTK